MSPIDLSAPADMVDRYLELEAEKRRIDAALGYVRAELELAAAENLTAQRPRGAFRGGVGGIGVALRPTCVFDRSHVAASLQKMSRLHEVARLDGPTLARFLAREPIVAARLGPHVRARNRLVFLSQRDI